MTPRKRLEGSLADWYPHPKGAPNSLVPVVHETAPADDVADQFFESTPSGYAPEPPPVVETSDHPSAHSAAARERRRYLMRYVAGAVGMASVIVLGALVRFSIMRASAAQSDSRSRPSTAAFAAEPETPSPARAPLELPAPPPSKANDDSAGDSPSAADVPTVTATESATPDLEPSAASDAKRAAQLALNHGRLPESIEAGELSVSLDPTDAEAWLILGAAYQMRGSYSHARRCFASCGRLAKRGARSECRALLR